MTIRYVKRPEPHQARLFMGDRENATDVSSWLADNHIHSAWYDKVEETEDAPARRERLVIELENDEETTVAPGFWLVIDQAGQLTVYSDELFLETFSIEPVPIRY